MKIGYLFPGQGTQTVGMGKDLYEKYEAYRNIYQRANDLTGYQLEDITFHGPEEQLNQTKYTQIAVLTMSLAILELLNHEKIEPAACLGLSLGEYSALVCGKALNFEDGIKIIKKRGILMQELCPKGDWHMVAIIGLDEEKVTKICKSITSGFIAPANFNCPGQIVVSGEKEAIEEAIQKAKEEGARKTVELNTAGPFHTIMLEEAAKKLKEELENITIHKFETSVIKNIDGKVYNDNDNIKDILAKHIMCPVRMEEGIRTMLNMGIDTFVEIGPGKTLSGFVKRINKEVNVININSVETLENAIAFIKGGNA